MDIESVDYFFAQHGGKVENFKFQRSENEPDKSIFTPSCGKGDARIRISLLIDPGEEQSYRDHYLALGASEYSAKS